MDDAIRLYVGVNETRWNKHPVDPDGYACVAPVYGATTRTKRKNSIWLPPGTRTISDCGAFSDGPQDRVTPAEAMTRQLDHAKQYGYIDSIDGFATYDLLIDEMWYGGARTKRRWTESAAWEAVDITVDAAKFLDGNRSSIPSPLVISSQGVSPQQYMECAKRTEPYFKDGDILGLGGWCIIGKAPSLIHSFREIISEVIPYAARFTRRVHIWGVMYAPALGHLLWECDQHGLSLSTDSTGPSIRPARGVWGYMGWSDRQYQRPSVDVRGLHRARHVRATKEWLGSFRATPWYKDPNPLRMFTKGE